MEYKGAMLNRFYMVIKLEDHLLQKLFILSLDCMHATLDYEPTLHLWKYV